MKKVSISVTGLLAATLVIPTIASASTITVKPGDTLYKIATENKLSVDTLKSLNKLSSNSIFPGQHLLVSKSNETSTASSSNISSKKEYRTVTGASVLNVRKGPGSNYSVISTIKGGTQVEILSAKDGWYNILVDNVNGYAYASYFSTPSYVNVSNSTTNKPVTPATTPEKKPAPISQDDTYYTVKSGDTLWGISAKYNIKVNDIKILNKLTSDIVFNGQKLLVKKSSTQSTPNTPTPPSQITPPPSTNTTYTVQAGDTLSTIATKFNTTIDTIKSLNNLSNYTIFVGQTLKVKAQTLAIFNWPTDGIITSGFGTRPEFRPGEFHYGLDIAKNGNVEVKAAADGVVTRSYLSDSYGEVVFIKHQINGQTYETVYAHMRTGSRAVQVGDIVKAGQFIGWMGATGDATGQHLHFEVNKGLWTANKANEVDPLLYLK